MVPSLATCFLEDHLIFLSKTGAKTSKKFSLPSLFEGTALSKVGSTLSKALLLTGSDRVSIAEGQIETENCDIKDFGNIVTADKKINRVSHTFSYTGKVVIVSFYYLLSCSFSLIWMMLQHDCFVCWKKQRIRLRQVIKTDETNGQKQKKNEYSYSRAALICFCVALYLKCGSPRTA